MRRAAVVASGDKRESKNFRGPHGGEEGEGGEEERDQRNLRGQGIYNEAMMTDREGFEGCTKKGEGGWGMAYLINKLTRGIGFKI